MLMVFAFFCVSVQKSRVKKNLIMTCLTIMPTNVSDPGVDPQNRTRVVSVHSMDVLEARSCGSCHFASSAEQIQCDGPHPFIHLLLAE